MAHSLEIKLSKLLPQCTFRQLKQIHAFIVTTSLNHDIQTFSKFLRRSTEFGTMEYPSLLYSQLGPHLSNNIIIQNAMIRGYDRNGLFEQCLQLFDEMPQRGLKPHNFTYPYVLNSCSELGWFRRGRQVHCRIVKDGFESNPSVAYALFHLYAKMVDLNDARNIFMKCL